MNQTSYYCRGPSSTNYSETMRPTAFWVLQLIPEAKARESTQLFRPFWQTSNLRMMIFLHHSGLF